jgi:glycosyltransferase 2 family protein
MTAPTTSPDPRSRARPAVIWTVKLVVSAGLLYYLLANVDLERLWGTTRSASLTWLAGALLLYLGMIVVSAWRWDLLLRAQHITARFPTLVNSFLVALFFNNFLPSNIGGDVVRIRDTSRAAGSKTLATTVVLMDRGIGLLGLVFMAAVGATLAARRSDSIGPLGPGVLWAMLGVATAAAAPAVLAPHRIGQLLSPLRRLHQDWVETRIERLTSGLARFRERPAALVSCFVGAILVQAVLVGFYAAIAYSIHLRVPVAHLAIVVPLSFVVQMLPVSVNGWGVRESTFGYYLTQIGLPLESAIALSFIGAVLMMIFSLSGAVAYLVRRPADRPDAATAGLGAAD